MTPCIYKCSAYKYVLQTRLVCRGTTWVRRLGVAEKVSGGSTALLCKANSIQSAPVSLMQLSVFIVALQSLSGKSFCVWQLLKSLQGRFLFSLDLIGWQSIVGMGGIVCNILYTSPCMHYPIKLWPHRLRKKRLCRAEHLHGFAWDICTVWKWLYS